MGGQPWIPANACDGLVSDVDDFNLVV